MTIKTLIAQLCSSTYLPTYLPTYLYSDKYVLQKSLMVVIERRPSEVRTDRPTNWATVTSALYDAIFTKPYRKESMKTTHLGGT